MTDGFRPGQLIIVAARPGAGKSAYAMNVARKVAEKSNVLVFSLEMSRSELIQRLVYTEARIDSRMVRRGQLREKDWTKLAGSWSTLNSLKLVIDDTSYLTPLEIRAKARRVKADSGLGMVIVDYVGLMDPSNKRENTNQDLSEIMKSLKGLSKELSVPVLALSQLSRNTERREAHRPQLSDLRDSGSLEQTADVVLFLYRDCMYAPTDTNMEEAEIIVAKQRSGPTGIVPVRFIREYTEFSNPLPASF
jgi:replicative DNA helicase